MASFADIAGIDMSWAFRCGRATAMTTKAVIHDAGVIKDNIDQPAIRYMTDATVLGGDRMRRTLARGNDTIVATGAGTKHFGMINCYHRIPTCNRMTGFAHIGRVDVCR